MALNKGFVLLFVGLAVSGKSTIAKNLAGILDKKYGRQVKIIESDEYIKLNFPKESFVFDMDTRLKLDRIIAKDLLKIVKQQEAIILDKGNPTEAGRRIKGSSPIGNFIYLKALLSCFGIRYNTKLQGINLPFEMPEKPDVYINSAKTNPLSAVNQILKILQIKRYI